MIFCIGEKKANLREETKSSNHKGTKWQQSEGSEGAHQKQAGEGSTTMIKGGNQRM